MTPGTEVAHAGPSFARLEFGRWRSLWPVNEASGGRSTGFRALGWCGREGGMVQECGDQEGLGRRTQRKCYHDMDSVNDLRDS